MDLRPARSRLFYIIRMLQVQSLFHHLHAACPRTGARRSEVHAFIFNVAKSVTGPVTSPEGPGSQVRVFPPIQGTGEAPRSEAELEQVFRVSGFGVGIGVGD